MSEYVIINKTVLEKRIKELEEVSDENNGSPDFVLKCEGGMEELKQILFQSIPLMPEIEDAYDAGKLDEEFSLIFDNPKGKYISNLKLDV